MIFVTDPTTVNNKIFLIEGGFSIQNFKEYS